MDYSKALERYFAERKRLNALPSKTINGFTDMNLVQAKANNSNRIRQYRRLEEKLRLERFINREN